MLIIFKMHHVTGKGLLNVYEFCVLDVYPTVMLIRVYPSIAFVCHLIEISLAYIIIIS